MSFESVSVKWYLYFGIEVDLVWPVVENDLPVPKRMVQDLLATEYPPDSGWIERL